MREEELRCLQEARHIALAYLRRQSEPVRPTKFFDDLRHECRRSDLLLAVLKLINEGEVEMGYNLRMLSIK